MLKKFGNSLFWIQHVQIRLEHISKHFYQKMPSQVTFSGFPASLFLLSARVGQLSNTLDTKDYLYSKVTSNPVQVISMIKMNSGIINMLPFKVSLLFGVPEEAVSNHPWPIFVLSFLWT